MAFFTHSSGEYLQVGDATIYFEVTGNPSGEALLLLHGGMGNLTDFNGIVDKLPNQFKLIGMDFRGHGKSTLGTSRLSYSQHQTDAEAVLAHLGIDSFSVLGFSDGGVAALRMAAATPSRIKALVAVAAHSQMDPNDPVLPILKGMTGDKWKARFPDAVAYYMENNPEADFEALLKAVVLLWTDLEYSAYPGSTIKHISAPTLVVRGDEDHLYSLACAVELRDHIKNAAFLNVPHAGHEVYQDAPEVFLAAVNKFLVHPH